MQQVLDGVSPALRQVEELLPNDFPMEIHESVCAAVGHRLNALSIL
jgi:hypothetical protein